MLYLFKIEDPYSDNIEMIITSKDKETAVKLFKKAVSKFTTKKFGESQCKSYMKGFKSEYKNLLKSKYDCDETKEYYLNRKKYTVGDLKFNILETIEEGFYEKILNAYKDYYYREGYSLEYHLDNDIFEVINLSVLDSGNKILNTTYIYHGR